MISLWVAFLALSVFLFNLLRTKDKNKGLPGPTAIPFFGNIFQVIKSFKAHTYPFTYFADIYGEIYRLKVPFGEIVVLASYDAVTTVFNKDESAGRDTPGTIFDRNFGENAGILLGNGEIWDNSRKWAVRNLRDFGFSKSNLLQNSVNIEIEDYFTNLNKKEKDGKIIFQISHTFLVHVSRIMYKMIAGPHSQIKNETLIELNRQTSMMDKANGFTGTAGAALAIYFPFIRFIFPKWTGRNYQLSCRQLFQKVSRELLAAATKKMAQPGAEPISLTEKFVVQKLKGAENNGNSTIFTDLNHDILFADLFQASTHTTSSFLESLFLYMILNPNVQDKVYREIQDTVPVGHGVTYEDKTRMIYTQAVILECHRVAKIVQNLLPHKAVADFEYKNFKIKKNSMIVADLNSIFSNPGLFEDPTSFKPERFIDSNGSIVNQKLIIAFSVGKRSCPGELFADVTSFLFFINILKKYKLSTVPGEPKPKQEMHIGVTSSPHPFSILMTRRGATNETKLIEIN